MRKPILSICIPTYNRAELLKSALLSLAPQVRELSGEIELIVSDNCSLDHTQEVVAWAQQFGPIRYHRNSENVGAARNIMLLANELATGEFGWIIPDDDVARPDAVQRVLAVLKTHPEVDYVFVNVSPKRPAERHAFGRPVTGADFPELLPVKSKSLTDRYIEQWEELIDPDIDGVFLGSVMCSVFRLSLWREHRLEIVATDKTFPSLEHTYPHSVLLAHTMRGHAAYYIGYPCVVTFFGEQEWIGYLPMIVLVRLQELLDLYQQLGVARWRVERCRRSLLSGSEGALQAMFMDPRTPGREYFSLRQFLWRNRHHPKELRRILTSIFRTWMLKRLPKPVYQALRAVKRDTLRLLTRS